LGQGLDFRDFDLEEQAAPFWVMVMCCGHFTPLLTTSPGERRNLHDVGSAFRIGDRAARADQFRVGVEEFEFDSLTLVGRLDRMRAIPCPRAVPSP